MFAVGTERQDDTIARIDLIRAPMRRCFVSQKERYSLSNTTRDQLFQPRRQLGHEDEDLAAQARRASRLRDFTTAQKLCKDILSDVPSHVESFELLG